MKEMVLIRDYYIELQKGCSYDEMPEVRLFYIGAKDFQKSRMTEWEVEKRRSKTHEQYEDGLHTTYINAEIDDRSEVARLMKYFKTADPEDMSAGELSERVHFLKRTKRGQTKMCEVTDWFWKKGYFPDVELPEDLGRDNRSSCLRIGTFLVIEKLMMESMVDKIVSSIYNGGRRTGLFTAILPSLNLQARFPLKAMWNSRMNGTASKETEIHRGKHKTDTETVKLRPQQTFV